MLPPVFRNIGRYSYLIMGESNFIYNPLNCQSVRWRRKARWLPVAKSKMFRIPKRPVIPEEEQHELRRLHQIYKTNMKSLSAFFAQKNKESETGEDAIAEQVRLEEEDHLRCLKLNDKWNADVAALRVSRVAKEKEIQLEKIVKKVEEFNKIEEERKAEAELLVKQELERAKTFITPENIDEALEKALSTVVDHNFAIDIEGNRLIGKMTKPEKSQTVNSPQNVV